MNKYYYILLIGNFNLSPFYGDAQITLTASSNPKIGDMYTYRFVDPTTFDAGSSGANVSWEYTDLTYQGISQYELVDPASLSYGHLFQMANIGFEFSNGIQSFFQVSNQALRFCGEAGFVPGTMTELINIYSDPWDQIQLPLTYTDSITDYFQDTSGNGFRSGTTVIIADAYGALTTPAHIYQNVLRLKTETNFYDEENGDTLIIWQHICYSWYSDNSNFPIMEYVEISLVNIGTMFASWRFLDDKSTNIPAAVNPSLNFQLYPNPSSGCINLTYTLKEAGYINIEVINILGQSEKSIIEERLNSGNQHSEADLSDLSKGTYIIMMSIDGQSVCHKMIVLR